MKVFILLLATISVALAASAPSPAPSSGCNADDWKTATKSGDLLTLYSKADETFKNGAIRNYVSVSSKDTCAPVEIGITFSKKIFDSLPGADGTAIKSPPGCEDDPLKAGCPPPETLVSIPFPLANDTEFSPFKFSLNGWAPIGHPPSDVYSAPHIDFHFYFAPEEELKQFTPGPCNDGAPAAFETTNKAIPANCFPPTYINTGAYVPGQGNHYVNTAAPEIQALLSGKPSVTGWNQTFIYGGWDGEITFWEPMVKISYMESLNKEACWPIPGRPSNSPVAGNYPKTYCVKGTADNVTVYYKDFEKLPAGCDAKTYAQGSYLTLPPTSPPLPAECKYDKPPAAGPTSGPKPAPSPGAAPSGVVSIVSGVAVFVAVGLQLLV